MTDPRHFTDPAWGEQEAKRQGLHWHQAGPEGLKTTGVITKITVAHLGAPRPTIRVPAWRKPNEDDAEPETVRERYMTGLRGYWWAGLPNPAPSA